MSPAHSASSPALNAQLGAPPASSLLLLLPGVLLSRQTVLARLQAGTKGASSDVHLFA
jgi:hypothetical protein